ncbi:DUF6233 domain-containing protein [Streptomyces sp. NPDC057565]|uniref:DUF6233 domain-containing protein n=1 Tax=Streptomyces sp. NPDC057565 TaxID=3346169 RepID=UPI00367937F8
MIINLRWQRPRFDGTGHSRPAALQIPTGIDSNTCTTYPLPATPPHSGDVPRHAAGPARQRIGEVEQQERGKPRGGEQQRAEQAGQHEQEKRQPTEPPSEERRPRPRTPDWGITDVGIGVPRAEVHRGDCWVGRELRAVSREEAAAALAEGIPACEVCQPDTVLGRQG